MITPPSTPPANPVSKKTGLFFVLSIVGILMVLLVLLLSQQGAYLKSKIFPNRGEDTASGANIPVDDYTRQEARCHEQEVPGLSLEECIYVTSDEVRQKEAVCEEGYATCQETCGTAPAGSASPSSDPCFMACEETYYFCLDEAQDYENAENFTTN